MTYEEAKAEAFRMLIPPVGEVFSCPASDHHGGEYPAVWEVIEYQKMDMLEPIVRALRFKPDDRGLKVWNWSLSHYWHELNVGRAKRMFSQRNELRSDLRRSQSRSV